MQNKTKKLILLFFIVLLFIQTIFSLQNRYSEKAMTSVILKDGNEYIVRVYEDCKKQIKEGVIVTITNKISNQEITRVKLFEIDDNDPSCVDIADLLRTIGISYLKLY